MRHRNTLKFTLITALVFIAQVIIFNLLDEKKLLLVCSISTVLFSTTLLLSRRILFSLFIISSISAGIIAAGIFKEHILGMPFLFNDIYYFFVDLSANKATLIHYPRITLSILFVGLFFIAVATVFLRFEKPFGNSFCTLAVSYLILPAPLILYVIFYASPSLKVESWDNIALFFESKSRVTKFVASGLLFNSQQLPKFNLSTANTESSSQFTLQKKQRTQNSRLPDIVAILHESAMNFSQVADCPSYFCNLNLFQPDMYTTNSGVLNVHIHGGGTWLSEFSFLTGLDYRLFGSTGFYAPYTLAPHIKNTLPKTLRKNGYKTIAIYPVSGNFIHAKNAYTHYGFDEFFSSDDLELTDNWLKLDDSQLYEKALLKMGAHGNKPVFVFILTIQGHGPYLSALNNDTLLKHPQSSKDPDYRQLEIYRERYQKSVLDLEVFEKKLLTRKRDTLIVRFGDHQPGFSGTLKNLKFKNFETNDKAAMYHTEYILKSNIPGRQKNEREAIDIAFLSSSILKNIGISDDEYFHANMTFRKQCKDSFLNCANANYKSAYLTHIFAKLGVYE